jgi:acyl carrier protein
MSKNKPKREKNALLPAEVIRNRDYNTIKAYLINLIESKVGVLPVTLSEEETELTEIGIDSLRSMELINAVNKDLDINLDVKNAYQNNTLSQFAGSIENILWLKAQQPIGKEITI